MKGFLHKVICFIKDNTKVGIILIIIVVSSLFIYNQLFKEDRCEILRNTLVIYGWYDKWEDRVNFIQTYLKENYWIELKVGLMETFIKDKKIDDLINILEKDENLKSYFFWHSNCIKWNV